MKANNTSPAEKTDGSYAADKKNRTKASFAKRASVIFLCTGALLICAALVLTCKNIYEERRAEKRSLSAVNEIVDAMNSDANGGIDTPPAAMPDADMQMPVKEIDGREYVGVLRIPSLGLELPVLNEWSYGNLTVAPCRYSGSAYSNDLIICAHNYRSHFARLSALRPGDTVSFTDMNSVRFDYEVVETETLLPDRVADLVSDNPSLTLFTCTFGGEYRITVRLTRTAEH